LIQASGVLLSPFIASPFGASLYVLKIFGYSPFDNGIWHTVALVFLAIFILVEFGSGIFLGFATILGGIVDLLAIIGTELEQERKRIRRLGRVAREKILLVVSLVGILALVGGASVAAVAPIAISYMKQEWQAWNDMVRRQYVPKIENSPTPKLDEIKKPDKAETHINYLPNAFEPLATTGGPNIFMPAEQKAAPSQSMHKKRARGATGKRSNQTNGPPLQIFPDEQRLNEVKRIPCIVVTPFPIPPNLALCNASAF